MQLRYGTNENTLLLNNMNVACHKTYHITCLEFLDRLGKSAKTINFLEIITKVCALCFVSITLVLPGVLSWSTPCLAHHVADVP